MKKINILALSLLAGILFFNSCKKKFDLPAKGDIPVSGYITIDSIYKKYVDYYQIAMPSPTKLFKFTTDINLECTVTADEYSGNIYKTVYVEDAAGNALQVKLIAAGGLYVGDKIRINLNNVVLDDYGQMVQLDSIDITKHVVKISSGNIVTPTKLTMTQAKSLGIGGLLKYQARLITLDTLEFSDADKTQPYADAIGKYSIDRTLLSATSKTIDLRTSGYAKFASYITPCGKGPITAILTEYNGSAQLTIRDYNEVKINSGYCPLVVKTFNDQSIASGGWSTYNVIGTIPYTIGNYNGRLYANISNYVSSTNYLCETWMISPSLNLTGATNPRFSFESAYKYTGTALEVWVSTNYNSGAPSTATWTQLTGVTLSSGNFVWTPSGTISLSGYISANTHVAFKYTGTGTSGSTWEIDNISIYAN